MKQYLFILLGCLLVVTACKKNKQEEMHVPLAVTSFWPNSGNAGTIVTIRGTGFSRTAKENEVNFNGTLANVVDVNDTTLIALAPSGATSGNITVKTSGKETTAGIYTYQRLSIKAVSPLNGPAGTNVTISGSGFNSISSPAVVSVNGKEALVTSMNDSLLIVAVPVDAGSGSIKVKVDGKDVNGPDFRFQKISRIKPLKGGKGTTVKISGEGFSNDMVGNSIDFNGKAGKVISASEQELTVATPDDVATGPLSVTINGQRTVGPVFTVIPPPALTAIAPLSSPAGALVTINGKNFSTETDENNILFNGIKAVVKTASETQLTVLVPAGAGSSNMLINVNGQQIDGPLFKEQNLGVISLMPDNGLEGSEVKVTGIGFSRNINDNSVSINGVAVTVLNATETTLTIKAPAGVTTGTVDVKVGSLKATGPLFKRAGVMTLAGGPSSNAFSNPSGLGVDAQGNLYTCSKNQIMKITPSGTVSSLAGSTTGAVGNRDGKGADALFNNPRTLVMDGRGYMYVIDGDFTRSFVRRIELDGTVQTLFNMPGALPAAIGVSTNGTVYISKQYQGVFRLETNNTVTRVGSDTHTFENQMTVGPDGNIYMGGGDFYNPFLMKMTAQGNATTLAGNQFEPGFIDGDRSVARFYSPTGIAYDAVSGNMYILDATAHALRMVTFNGTVTTICGAGGTMDAFKAGYVDGPFNTVYFRNPTDLCVDKQGTVYILDKGNNAIRKVFLK